MKTTHTNLRRRLAGFAAVALAAAGSLVAVTTQAATAATDIYLCARPASASVADPNGGAGDFVTVPFHGFATAPTAADCATAIPALGDPTPIRLLEGESYDIHLVNQTGFDINFSAAGLTGIPDLDGVGDGATKTYGITASEAGTYLFESDLDPRHSLLGLTGVMVVDPVGGGSAHGTTISEYDVERLVVMSEVDVSYNTAADPFSLSLLDYEPDLFLLNGQTHTDDSALPPVLAAAGDRLLLRYVNAGSTNSSMGSLGVRQSVVAFDGEVFTGAFGVAEEQPQDLSQVFLTAGQTADAIIAVDGEPGDRFSIANRNLRTSATGDNGAQLLMIEVDGGGGVDPVVDLYLSFGSASRNFNGVVVADEDIVRWDGTVLSIVFDGSALGLGGTALDGSGIDIDAVHVAPSGKIYFSLRADVAHPGTPEWAAVVGDLQENDVYVWDSVAGTFATWLEGSAIGLSDTLNRHDINAVHVDEDAGVTYFSTNGSIRTSDGVVRVSGTSGTIGARNEDVLMLTPTVPGTLALGYELTVLADGQDFGLGLENVDGLALSGADLLFSLTTEFTDPTPTAFDRDDLIGCLGFTPAVLPSTTDTCIAPLTLEFDADVLHANNAGQVDGYSVG